MKKENEAFLKNMRALCASIAKAQTEEEMKHEVSSMWGWLAIRAIAGRHETIDRVLPDVLEAIEKAYEWDIPTMDEIDKELDEIEKESEND